MWYELVTHLGASAYLSCLIFKMQYHPLQWYNACFTPG